MAPEWLSVADGGWPQLTVVRELGRADDERPPGTVAVETGRVRIWLHAEGLVEITRGDLTIRIVTREPVGDEAVLHPLLALPGAFAASWFGRRSLHGAAFVHDGGAWALMGDKEGGKSTTLGALLRRGHAVLTDDVLTLDGLDLFPGPRTIDLREEAATVLGGEELGILGERTRWRLRPPPPLVAPLRGIVHLAWGEASAIEPLHPRARLAELIRHRVLRPGPEDGEHLLELAGLPTVRFTRPRDLDRLDEHLDQLLAALPAS